jgi:tRNA A37 threonylcarbamoyladenosine modification protein TsaB
MATAKGLCYAFKNKIPLITFSTLKAMAYWGKNTIVAIECDA